MDYSYFQPSSQHAIQLDPNFSCHGILKRETGEVPPKQSCHIQIAGKHHSQPPHTPSPLPSGWQRSTEGNEMCRRAISASFLVRLSRAINAALYLLSTRSMPSFLQMLIYWWPGQPNMGWRWNCISNLSKLCNNEMFCFFVSHYTVFYFVTQCIAVHCIVFLIESMETNVFEGALAFSSCLLQAVPSHRGYWPSATKTFTFCYILLHCNVTL